MAATTLFDLMEGRPPLVATPRTAGLTAARMGYAVYATDGREGGEEWVSYAEAEGAAQALERCRGNFGEPYWTGHRVRVIGPAC